MDLRLPRRDAALRGVRRAEQDAARDVRRRIHRQLRYRRRLSVDGDEAVGEGGGVAYTKGRQDLREGADMKSPFPGMDPFVESRWRDFHTRFITYLSDM